MEVLVGPRCHKIDEPVPGKVHIDRCIASEVAKLNREGIRTLGSCCARDHPGPFDEAWIAVYAEDAGRLRDLGYEVRPARFAPHPNSVEVSPSSLR